MTEKECYGCKQVKPLDQYEQKVTKKGKPYGRIKKLCNICLAEFRERMKPKNSRRPKSPKGVNYEQRNEALKLIGFESYKDYLQSELWASVRKKVFKLKGRKCHLCGERATEVHHNRYHLNDLTGRKIRFLAPICHGCHGRIEFLPNGKKAQLKEAKKSFGKIRRHRNRTQPQ